jgi:hypothetical protein
MRVWKCDECNRGPCKIETNLEMDQLLVDFLPCDNDAKWQETNEFEILERKTWNASKEEISKDFTKKVDDMINKKEPELMTLGEAWEKAEKGERIEHPVEASFIKDDFPPPFELSYESAVEKKWQIIPAEPKVLSVEEMFTNTFDEHHPLYGYKRFIIDLLKAVHNNGRLERDLELKPLLDFIGKHSPGDRIDVNRLYEIYVDIENLKPVEDK